MLSPNGHIAGKSVKLASLRAFPKLIYSLTFSKTILTHVYFWLTRVSLWEIRETENVFLKSLPTSTTFPETMFLWRLTSWLSPEAVWTGCALCLCPLRLQTRFPVVGLSAFADRLEST